MFWRPVPSITVETIRGHVFCSFLALMLRKELEKRLESKGHAFEWADIRQDLEALQEVTIMSADKKMSIRTECKGVCGKVFQAVGVAVPPVIRSLAKIKTLKRQAYGFRLEYFKLRLYHLHTQRYSLTG